MSEKENKTIIFVETKKRCDELTRRMRRDGWPAMGIHGDKSQQERDWVLNEFKYGKACILIATDVASRGLGGVFVAWPRHDNSRPTEGEGGVLELDVEDVKFVINYDYPNSSEDYIHRIGRTARSQKTGTAYTFFTPNNMKQASDLISVLREANQAINPKLIQIAEDRGGRSHGGRSGCKDDRRDRYSGGGRRDFSSYRDRDSDRGYGSGPKVQSGGYGGNSYDKSNNSSSNYGNGYGGNGQVSYNTVNSAVAFGNQNFPNQSFTGNQAPVQNGIIHPQYPFNPPQPPQQPPQPMVPYPMPPSFTQ
ncbi:putative ATP-dependent RNA helicase DDX5 [Labeo rohita]|uniref:ATP-dependent RNA helicase DDX5 n=1 Tax=Labeo rohita TaxID=84645 RepID=A0ABQ8MKT1_LABRO|nr:putative ATP-dependent RNA helicase DDX5 [Labeo rohita]